MYIYVLYCSPYIPCFVYLLNTFSTLLHLEGKKMSLSVEAGSANSKFDDDGRQKRTGMPAFVSMSW